MVDGRSAHEGHSTPTAYAEAGGSTVKAPAIPQERAARRILAMALPQQLLADELTQSKDPDGEAASLGDDATIGSTVLRSYSSTPQLLRSLSVATEEFFIISLRPGLIWDSTLLARVEREIDVVQALGIPWFCLTADGMDLKGGIFFSAHFDYEPTLTPSRGRLPIVQTVATLVVVKASSYRALGLKRPVRDDIASFLNDLIILAYARNLPSYFSSNLFPCVAEHRGLVYKPIEDQLVALNVSSYLEMQDVEMLFPPGVRRDHLLRDWVDEAHTRGRADHRFSFVVRTLFKRKYLLERCLISIEYLRSSLGFKAEVVLATDVDTKQFDAFLRGLRSNFPKLDFVVADGRAERGHSRVRNLIAGVKASTGDRVCIIDDDDYYTPQAVKFFDQATIFGVEEIILFDTQVLVEHWDHGGVKPHREIVAYRDLFAARDWNRTLNATNSIPFCGAIHPGNFVRQVIGAYVFDFDYSEDFLFHIQCFTHPTRPTIRVEDGIGAYQSHREKDDNVSMARDRRKWTTDTGNGLYQLLFEQGRTFDVVSNETAGSAGLIESLRAEVKAAREGQEQAARRLAELIGRNASASSTAWPKAGWPISMLAEAGTRAQKFVTQVSTRVGGHLRSR